MTEVSIGQDNAHGRAPDRPGGTAAWRQAAGSLPSEVAPKARS